MTENFGRQSINLYMHKKLRHRGLEWDKKLKPQQEVFNRMF